jgi:hypothetical protein
LLSWSSSFQKQGELISLEELFVMLKKKKGELKEQVNGYSVLLMLVVARSSLSFSSHLLIN